VDPTLRYCRLGMTLPSLRLDQDQADQAVSRHAKVGAPAIPLGMASRSAIPTSEEPDAAL